jgi:undecaprenyl-diphosphatase
MNTIEGMKAAILGVVEGLTEFLPVSSTGHLILAADLLNFDTPVAKLFEVVIQLGAILAVAWYYRAKLIDVVLHLNRRTEQMFVLKLIVAFLPSAVIGILFHSFIKSVLFSPVVVAVALIVGGIIIWLVEKMKPEPVVSSVDAITLRRAFLIGCAQAVSVIPGTSRSGATIIGGMLLRLDRKTAAEFSFFLAIPTMLAASAFDLWKSGGGISGDDMVIIAIGFVTAFISGFAAIKLFLAFVARHSFKPFAIYRIVLGALMLWFYCSA